MGSRSGSPAPDAAPRDRRVVGTVALALSAMLLATVPLATVPLATGPRAEAWVERLTQERDAAALVSPDRRARREAAERLGRLGTAESSVPALLAALERETDPEVRTAIVGALARHRDPRALGALTASLSRARDAERVARARALAAIDDPLARRALAELLTGSSADVAQALIEELGLPMTTELVPLLDVPASAARAARALGRIGAREAVDALLPGASAEDVAIRAAVVEALGRLGDGRAVPVLIAATRDPAAPVAVAAAEALGRRPEDGAAHGAAEALEEALDRAEAEVARAALVALAAIAPQRAAPALDRALAGPHAAAAWAAMLATPDAAFIPLLVREAGDPARRGEAADALGRIPEGAGAPALVELAVRHGDALTALALALRRWPGIESGLRERGLDVLSRESDPERAAWLRAIARDERARDPILALLASPDPAARATAARSLALLGRRDPGLRDALSRALSRETDPMVLEVASEAATALGARPGAPPLEWVDDPERAAATLRLLAIATAPASHREARERRRALTGALVARSARLRATAARALGALGDRRAAIAVAARLEDESPEVRRAAITALAALDAPSSPRLAGRLESRLAIESEPEVRRALRAALAGSPSPAGGACLDLRLSRPGRVEVELVLPDGTWLRDRTLPTGELVVCDLPEAEIDVRPAP